MPRPHVALAGTFLGHLADLGIIPRTTRRLVIDAKMDEVVIMYVEQIGSPELLKVTADDFRGVFIKIGDKEASLHG